MPGEDGLSMQSLHDAIMEALLNGGLLSDETLERLLGKDWQTSEDAEGELDELIQRIIEKLQHQGYVSTVSGPRGGARAARARRRRRRQSGPAVQVRDHRQESGLSRLSRAARSARIDRQEQPRAARHARDGDRSRGQRRAEARTSSATR